LVGLSGDLGNVDALSEELRNVGEAETAYTTQMFAMG